MNKTSEKRTTIVECSVQSNGRSIQSVQRTEKEEKEPVESESTGPFQAHVS
jgi:hypothetical protein